MKPLVSVIVTTYNNAGTLDNCLASVLRQTYAHAELIVVDNGSTDSTKSIAKRYTAKVFDRGPERSAQRNFGVTHAKGKYVLIIDSDMELSPDVIAACVEKVMEDSVITAVIVPEESFGQGFWAQCKRLERSFYVGNDSIEAARFFDKQTYQKLGGYNELLVGGEDWEFSQRMAAAGKLTRADALIHHNEGRLRLQRMLKKRFYYGGGYGQYFDTKEHGSTQNMVISRYLLFFSRPIKLFKNPFYGLGMLFMKTCEFGSGALGYLRQQSMKQKEIA